jgi:UDP-glucose 4-epimerase
MTEILVTGAFGYVGGRVAKHLAQLGHTVRLGTRHPDTPPPAWLRKGAVTACDPLDDSQLQAACRGVQCVVHLAAVNENVCAVDPLLALNVNGAGTLRTLLAAIASGARRFIYLSTAHVYGAPLAGRIDETTLPKPLHSYAISHRTAEDFVLAAQARSEIEGVVLRLSNGFGAAERAEVDRWTLLVNDLCRQAVTAGRMVMRSSGDDARDFITLEDTARAVAHFAGLDRAALGDGLFNVGSGKAMPVRAVADLITQRCELLLGFRPAIVRPQSQGAAPAVLDYRIDRLRATGFEPACNMQGEIDSTLELCRNAFGARS